MGFLEEVVHIPLIMRLPGVIEPGTSIARPVGHLDMVSTILDYLGYPERDTSDGLSLRPVIAGQSYRRRYDDEYTVSEEHHTGTGRSGYIDMGPNFMVRHGSWKFWTSKQFDSVVPDALYNLESDPHETTNLLEGETAKQADIIGKAEHLRCLLLEWLIRKDGGEKYFSDPKWNGNSGIGSISGVRRRRTWKALEQWQSDQVIELQAPVFVEGKWRSNAYFYMGRAAPGTLIVDDISLEGKGAEYFSLKEREARLDENKYLSVRIAFKSDEPVDMNAIDVQLVIQSNVVARSVVHITTQAAKSHMSERRIQ